MVFFFIPYEDIGVFEVVRKRLFGQLVVHLRGFEKPLKFNFLDSILGDDGLSTLHQRISPKVEGPPKLVIYGGRNVRTTASPPVPKLDR